MGGALDLWGMSGSLLWCPLARSIPDLPREYGVEALASLSCRFTLAPQPSMCRTSSEVTWIPWFGVSSTWQNSRPASRYDLGPETACDTRHNQ